MPFKFEYNLNYDNIWVKKLNFDSPSADQKEHKGSSHICKKKNLDYPQDLA